MRLHGKRGDHVIQVHEILETETPPIMWHLGIYDPTTCPNCQRLLTQSGDSYVVIDNEALSAR